MIEVIIGGEDEEEFEPLIMINGEWFYITEDGEIADKVVIH